MNIRPLPANVILATGVAMGLAGDFLLRAPGTPGLNFTLLFAGLVASVVLVSRRGGPPLSREARICLAVGVLFGGALTWRGSELLGVLAFLAASLALTLPALRAGRSWVRSAGVADLAEAVVGSGLHTLLGSLRLLQKPPPEDGRSESPNGSDRWSGTRRSLARSLLVGAALAVVPLAVFGALFMSADRVFARAVTDYLRVDLEVLASHVVVAGLLSWLACGYLAGFVSGTRLEPIRELGWARPSLRTAEAAVALGLVDLLFLAFVTVQFRYLFGGQELVEITPGLTYAAYAREGFFELVAATALGLPWLLAVDGLLGDQRAGGGRVFRVLAGAQLALLLVVVASAAQRMRVYLDAYGLTEERFVATAVLVWSALLVVWFAATALRGRRSSFAFGALTSGFLLVAVLQAADPAALSARSHLQRATASGPEDTGPGAEEIDVRYLASLGSDAAPVLVEGIDVLDQTGRCLLARSLLRRWGPDAEFDWRSWSYAGWRAQQAVVAGAPRLRTLAGDGETCPPDRVPGRR